MTVGEKIFNTQNPNVFKSSKPTLPETSFLFPRQEGFSTNYIKNCGLDFLYKVRNKVIFKSMPECQIWPILVQTGNAASLCFEESIAEERLI